MQLFWWLRRVLFIWVRTKVIPDNPGVELGLRAGIPVCYVLRHQSLSDALVLDEICARVKLPRPEHALEALSHPGSASWIYLQKIGLLQVERGGDKEPPSPLLRLVKQASLNPDMEVQIVPVSIFWGRNPGREERSIMKLLFFDDVHAGILQKFFIVLAQGRINFLQFGKPISLRKLADEGAPVEETARKLRRVLRVHFSRQRTSTMGPNLPSRAAVIASLMQTRGLKEAVADEARKRKITVERAALRARRYLAEIAAEQNWPMIRLADIFLTWLWNRIFRGVEVRHVDRLRNIDPGHEIVYMPSHRSHMDYLLLSYSLYYEGFAPPHTAAGVNLDFWPVGPLLRRCGAFYIRRSFAGNRLYTAAFNEYLHYLLSRGYSVKFYVEGGRSRTGRLLQPKTGMLSMVVNSYLRKQDRPIVFVPVFIGYDKVMEVRTYQTELRGRAKRTESVGQLVRARTALKTNFGKAYIGFGEPIYLRDYLAKHHPQWQSEKFDAEQKPRWLPPVVDSLANDILTRVNSSAVVSPLALFALVILSTPTKAIAEDDLIYLMGKLLAAMRAAPYSQDMVMPEGSARDHLRQAMAVCRVERFQHPSGDVLFLDEREAGLLTYYRNNVLHLLAVPALVASFFQHNDQMPKADLVEAASHIYGFLKGEFFLRWPVADSERVIANVVDTLISEGLLTASPDGLLHRPQVTSRDLTTLLLLGRVLGQTLERYAICTALLAKNSGTHSKINRKAFEQQCSLMAQRIAILGGINEPEFFDQNLFRNYLSQMLAAGYACETAEDQLTVNDSTYALANSALNLLSADIRQSIQRLGGEGITPESRL